MKWPNRAAVGSALRADRLSRLFPELITGNNIFETTSLVAVKNFPHYVLKSPIPLSNSNSSLQLKHPNPE